MEGSSNTKSTPLPPPMSVASLSISPSSLDHLKTEAQWVTNFEEDDRGGAYCHLENFKGILGKAWSLLGYMYNFEVRHEIPPHAHVQYLSAHLGGMPIVSLSSYYHAPSLLN